MLPLITHNDKKVLVDQLTEEMIDWLFENIGERDKDFAIVPNRVCIRHVLIPRPGHGNLYEYRGDYICFDSEEYAAAFKLRWL